MEYSSDDFFSLLPCLFIGYEDADTIGYPEIELPSSSLRMNVQNYECCGQAYHIKQLTGLFFPLSTCKDIPTKKKFYDLAFLYTWPNRGPEPYSVSELHEIAGILKDIGPLELEHHCHYSKCEEAFMTFNIKPAFTWVAENFMQAVTVEQGEVETRKATFKTSMEVLRALGHSEFPDYWDSECIEEFVEDTAIGAFLWANQHPTIGFPDDFYNKDEK